MAPTVSDQRRTDRGMPPNLGGPGYTDGQRLWLLERDLDDFDDHFADMKREAMAIRALVTNRLNWLVGIGFSVLIAVIAALVTFSASH